MLYLNSAVAIIWFRAPCLTIYMPRHHCEIDGHVSRQICNSYPPLQVDKLALAMQIWEQCLQVGVCLPACSVHPIYTLFTSAHPSSPPGYVCA